MSFRQKNNNFSESPFASRLPRDALTNEDVRHALLLEGSLKPFERDLLDGISNARGQVLHVEGVRTNTWFSRLLASRNSGTAISSGEFYRVRCRIDILHAMIPVPCKASSPKRGIIEMHPIFVCRKEAVEGINPGDVVTVSFSKGPKYGNQRDGTIEAVFQKGIGNYEGDAGDSRSICDDPSELFDGPRQSNTLGEQSGTRTAQVEEPRVLDNSKTITPQALYGHLFGGIGGVAGLQNRNLCIAMVANAVAESGVTGGGGGRLPNPSYEVGGDGGEYAADRNLSINVEQINGPSWVDQGLVCSFGLWQYNICGGLGIDLLRAYGVDNNSSVDDKLEVLKSYPRQVEFMIKHVKGLSSNISDPHTIEYWVDWFVRNVEKPAQPEEKITTRTRYARRLEQQGLGGSAS